MDSAAPVTETLARWFPGAVVEIGDFYGAERDHGYLPWASFESMKRIDRQQAVYDAIQLFAILTHTPEERALMSAA